MRLDAPASNPVPKCAFLAAGELPARAYALDALRGIAALVVVVWHWQHFFFDGASPEALLREAQPFYRPLAWLYHHGNLAVELFFVLSGFIFFWLFARGIHRHHLSGPRYLIDRLSRLYPLHLATFAAVAALQGLYLQSHAEPFVYLHQDLYHAALNLALLPAWGFEEGWSYNAPVWSVSIELLMYLIFYGVCRFAYPARTLLCLAMIAVGLQLLDMHYKVASGLMAFFSGGLTYQLWQRCMTAPSIQRGCLVALACITLAGWSYWLWSPALHYGALITLGYGSLIFWAAVAQHYRPRLGVGLAWLGDISFSIYLWHFPLQLAAVLITDAVGLSRAHYYSPMAMVLFLAVLILLSQASYRYLELPGKRGLRSLLPRPRTER